MKGDGFIDLSSKNLLKLFLHIYGNTVLRWKIAKNLEKLLDKIRLRVNTKYFYVIAVSKTTL